jgi:hypothetical protein
LIVSLKLVQCGIKIAAKVGKWPMSTFGCVLDVDPTMWHMLESNGQQRSVGNGRMTRLKPRLLHVVGCHYYGQAIASIIEAHKSQSGNSPFHYVGTATLQPEPENPADPNAVAVKVEGQLVGYIRKEFAQELKRAIGERYELACELIWDREPSSLGLYNCLLFDL